MTSGIEYDRLALRQRAKDAGELVLLDRAEAAALAESVLNECAKAGDAVAESVAHRALASVNLHRGHVADADAHIRQAIDKAGQASDPEVLGLALMTQMGILITIGEAQKAIDVSYVAEPLLPPPLQIRLAIQRGTALGLGLGKATASIAAFDEVARVNPVMEPQVEAVLRMNRGTQLNATGDHPRALEDFARARSLYGLLGNTEAECDVLLHEAMAAAQIGDFPRVFELEAEVAKRNLLANSDARTLNDMATALLAAGLLTEATNRSRQALALASGDANTMAAFEALLRTAQIQLQLNQPEVALKVAKTVLANPESKTHTQFRTLAHYVATRAQIELDHGWLGDSSFLIELAGLLELDGWAIHATEIRLNTAELALAQGRHGEVGEILEPVVSPRATGFKKLPAPAQARARHGEALRLIAAGQRGPARRQLAAGLVQLDRMRSTIGAEDLRAAASDRSATLARLGLNLAIGAGAPRPILDWAERMKATSLRLAVSSSPASGSGKGQLDALLRSSDKLGKRSSIEAQVTAQDRQRRQRSDTRKAISAIDLIARLGAKTLLEFVEINGAVHLLMVSNARVSFHPDIAATDEIELALDRLMFGVSRSAQTAGPAGSSTQAMAEKTAAWLDEVLLANLKPGDGELVIVPGGALHSLPWGLLHSIAHRPVTVAPSAHIWAVAQQRKWARQPLVAMAGPGVPCASSEISAVAKFAGNRSLGSPSTVAQAVSALATADAVHIAAHGTFRNDSPQFSSLLMADGPLYIYDLQAAGSMPSLIVLSACSVGTLEVLGSADVLGFPAAVLAKGARTLIAALVPVEDQAASDLMIEFHAQLGAGHNPAAALSAARRSVQGRSLRHWAAAGSFLCFGAS